MQGDAVLVFHAMAGPQKARVAVDQRWRQQTLLQQRLLAINVEQYLVQERGALADGGFNAGPFARRQDQRQHVQIPGPLDALGVGVDVVGDAVFAHLALHGVIALTHHCRRFA